MNEGKYILGKKVRLCKDQSWICNDRHVEQEQKPNETEKETALRLGYKPVGHPPLLMNYIPAGTTARIDAILLGTSMYIPHLIFDDYPEVGGFHRLTIGKFGEDLPDWLEDA